MNLLKKHFFLAILTTFVSAPALLPTPNSRSNRFLKAAQAIEAQSKCANTKA